MFDRDGNGFISKQELGMAMRSLGYMPNEVELEVIIQRLDMDGKSLASCLVLHVNVTCKYLKFNFLATTTASLQVHSNCHCWFMALAIVSFLISMYDI